MNILMKERKKERKKEDRENEKIKFCIIRRKPER